MNKTLAEALAFADALARALPEHRPGNPALRHPALHSGRQVKAALAETRVKVGAQNMHWEDHGAGPAKSRR